MQTFLEFEKPIQNVIEQIEKLKEVATQGSVDVRSTLKDLENKLAETRKSIYAGLSPWERVQVSRHPDRPYTLKYIELLSDNTFLELHGDPTVKDDKAMVIFKDIEATEQDERFVVGDIEICDANCFHGRTIAERPDYLKRRAGRTF